MKLDYTFDRQLMLEREDSREEGYEEGREEGLERGNVERLIVQICKKLKKNKGVKEIADDLEEEISTVEPICKLAEQFAPDYDSQRVIQEAFKQHVV